MTYKSEEKGKTRQLACGDCGRVTNHATVESVERITGMPDPGWTNYQDDQVVQCLGCDTVSFRRAVYNSEECFQTADGDWDHIITETLFPARVAGRKQLEDSRHIPRRIRAIYEETHFAVTNDKRILAGIGLRAIVEAVCAEKGIAAGRLVEKIDGLKNGGHVTPDGAAILHKIRLLGNEAAHEVEPPTSEQLMAAVLVIENLLASTFIMPALAKQIERK